MDNKSPTRADIRRRQLHSYLLVTSPADSRASNLWDHRGGSMEISGDAAGNRVARLAGAREQVRQARRLVSAVLGRDHPRHDDCVLLTSEIVTNAVIHSRSGQGGTFVITVSRLADRVRIRVEDDGSAAPPCAGHVV